MTITELRKNFKVKHLMWGGHVVMLTEKSGYMIDKTDTGFTEHWYISRVRLSENGWIGPSLKPEFKRQKDAIQWLFENKLKEKL